MRTGDWPFPPNWEEGLHAWLLFNLHFWRRNTAKHDVQRYGRSIFDGWTLGCTENFVACDYETLRGGGGFFAATHDEGAKASCEEGRVNGGLQIFEGCDHLYVLLVFQCI